MYQISDIVGHQDIKSTIAYNRYTLDKVKTREVMDEAVFNSQGKEGSKQVDEQELKQEIEEESKQKEKPLLIEKSNSSANTPIVP